MNSVTRLTTYTETAWERYIAAKERADETHNMDDGIEAARAWRAWLAEFMNDDEIAFLNNKTGG